MRISLSLLLSLIISLPALAVERYSTVRDALDTGRADDALASLGTNSDAYAENLRCRVYYAEERWNLATKACEAAVHADSTNSDYRLWLGRAYGEKADHSAFISAYSLAKRAAVEFEAAVQFDGKNLEALSDLGEFYAEAPSVVGGGLDKAHTIASRLQTLDAARYHMLLSRIAEREHDYATTETEIRAAIKAAFDPTDRWFDLASFYRRRGRWSEMIDAVHQGVAADTVHGSGLLDAAQNLRRSGRELDLAASLIRKYLNGGHLSEDSPAFRAHWLLGELLEIQGDQAAAQAEFQASAALAKDYKPGR